ncbi:aminotransferase class IV [Chiayiivirga flava]|uniref:Branched-subunit amino acid aminotransferase/4-amino-4-deoxychorismate lyase n=1 Tax=Chiayiivirga flava TaxID=659595 RepID=A0A7W8FYW6_9GAMM|nr:branched-subunit amino acid aminotransferase/4-amino-4-deoxychorismate lyase [Chiayiivirga flava]
MSTFAPRFRLDGGDATAAQLAHVARLNHGHFTSFQVRGGAVRGLDLHLARLRDATRALYATDLDPQHVRMLLRDALGGTRDAAVRITVFPSDWRLDAMPSPARVAVLVGVSPPTQRSLRPLRLCTVEHERFLPQIKHVGTFASIQLRAQARRDGFDDALFVDRHDCISEGTVWNIGFRADDRIVWPDAPQLDGVAMRLLSDGLARAGIAAQRCSVPRTLLATFDGAFVCNAGGVGHPVVAIDDIAFAVDDAFTQCLVACHDSNAAQAI